MEKAEREKVENSKYFSRAAGWAVVAAAIINAKIY